MSDDVLKIDLQAMRDAPALSPEGKRSIFCFSAGRSGTRWLATIMASHDNCHGGCERFPGPEAFYRYVTWYGLPVDMSGFHRLMKKAINHDWCRGEISVTASPYLCFGVKEIARVYSPSDIIVIVRKPEAVVSSLYAKGWYAESQAYDDRSRIPGVQPEHAGAFHRNFSRIFPKDDLYDDWAKLSVIGKISWYCTMVVASIYAAFAEVEGVRKWFMRLEDIDQNYAYYKTLAKQMGFQPMLSRKHYLSLKGNMSNRGRKKLTYSDWDEQGKKDFESIIGPYREIYDSMQTTGYTCRPTEGLGDRIGKLLRGNGEPGRDT